MPPRSPEPSSPDFDLESIEYELREVIRHELRSLNDEIRVLRQSIDALFEAFDHAILNGRVQYIVDPADSPTSVTSFALDPTAKDFQLNSVPPEELESLRMAGGGDSSTPPPSSESNRDHRPSEQAHLF